MALSKRSLQDKSDNAVSAFNRAVMGLIGLTKNIGLAAKDLDVIDGLSSKFRAAKMVLESVGIKRALGVYTKHEALIHDFLGLADSSSSAASAASSTSSMDFAQVVTTEPGTNQAASQAEVVTVQPELTREEVIVSIITAGTDDKTLIDLAKNISAKYNAGGEELKKKVSDLGRAAVAAIIDWVSAETKLGNKLP